MSGSFDFFACARVFACVFVACGVGKERLGESVGLRDISVRRDDLLRDITSYSFYPSEFYL